MHEILARRPPTARPPPSAAKTQDLKTQDAREDEEERNMAGAREEKEERDMAGARVEEEERNMAVEGRVEKMEEPAAEEEEAEEMRCRRWNGGMMARAIMADLAVILWYNFAAWFVVMMAGIFIGMAAGKSGVSIKQTHAGQMPRPRQAENPGMRGCGWWQVASGKWRVAGGGWRVARGRG